MGLRPSARFARARSSAIIRYPIILKTKFVGNLWRHFPAKNAKIWKTLHTCFWNGEFHIVAKFQVNCVKNNEDKWRWAFFKSHIPTLFSFARCYYICFPFALETCHDRSSSSKCQGWKENGFCTHPDHKKALIHWCPKTCYNCKFVYFRVSKTYF